VLKTCTKCGAQKPPEEFPARPGVADGRKPRCKPCHNAANQASRARHPEASRLASKRWADANREHVLARIKAWNQANVEHLRQRVKVWRELNPEKVRQSNKRQNDKRRGQIDARLRKRISECIRKSLRAGKGGRKTFELLGCTLAEFKAHLERQFLPGMTWVNMSEWEIDHILPLANFSYTTTECPDFRAAWSITNLRPLWAIDNARKGAQVLHLL
jgi:hypothetical protein